MWLQVLVNSHCSHVLSFGNVIGLDHMVSLQFAWQTKCAFNKKKKNLHFAWPKCIALKERLAEANFFPFHWPNESLFWWCHCNNNSTIFSLTSFEKNKSCNIFNYFVYNSIPPSSSLKLVLAMRGGPINTRRGKCDTQHILHLGVSHGKLSPAGIYLFVSSR